MTAPITTGNGGDIQGACGEASGDLGTCFVNGNWNKWARYKPVRSSKITPLTESELSDINYGLTFDVYVPNSSILDFVSYYSSQWGYDQPDSIPGDMFRMSDLTRNENGLMSTSVGYYGNAKSFVLGNKVETNSTSKANHYYVHHTESGVICGVDWYRTSRSDEIAISDFNMGITASIDGYFAVILIDETAVSDRCRIVCSSTKILSSSSSEVTIPDSVFNPLSQSLIGHTFRVYPVISTGNEHATGEGLVTDRVSWGLIPLPDVTIFSFDVQDAGQSLSVSIDNLQSHINMLDRQTASCAVSVRQTADILATSVAFRIRLYGGGTVSSATTLLDESSDTVSVSGSSTIINKSWGNSVFASRYEAVRVTVEATALTTRVWEETAVATNDNVND